MSKLAIQGGQPVLSSPLSPYPSVGEAEVRAVTDVVRSGSLSGFYGSWGDRFLGGPRVREFETKWAERFDVKHAVSVNSATSGLMAAMGAVGVEPGDEVIVPPYSMSATAVAPLIYGGIPVFADIEDETFGLDPAVVRGLITERTRAILAVNLFGHPAQLGELAAIAGEHGLSLVEDNAQGVLGEEDGRYCGTIGDIGVFSLNYHKHIHAGEGGVCVTDDDDLAERLRLIRNHGENVVDRLDIKDPSNLVGFNFRMTEMGAAVGLVQLGDVERHVGRRERVAQELTEGALGLEGLVPPMVRDGCRHVYYTWALRYSAEAVGVSRETFSRALVAEGFPLVPTGVRPLYLLPLFQRRVAFGSKGYPFNLSEVRYDEGICPTVERICNEELLAFDNCIYDVDDEMAKRLVEALRKVHSNRRLLVDSENE